MFVLVVRCYGDFDESYDEIVCCSKDKRMIHSIEKSLNRFCSEHPKVEQDVSLKVEFENPKSDLFTTISEVVDEEIAIKIYSKLEEICNACSVYIYGDIFSVKTILNIQIMADDQSIF